MTHPSHNHHDCNSSTSSYQAEVVGHKGRIGSFLYKAGAGKFVASSNRHKDHVWELPPIGSLTCINTPILVAVPAHEIPNVIDATPFNRRQDLVVLANCLPSMLPAVENMTYSVLHFGVLELGQLPLTNDTSPPTVLFGPYARFLSSLLQAYKVKIKIVSTFVELEKYALTKLLWISFMWLLCHDHDDVDHNDVNDFKKENNAGLTVVQVHELKHDVLRALVVESKPILEALLQNTTRNQMHSSKDSMEWDVNNIMNYLESYSRSMPNAIPRKDLAIREFQGRNGILLKFRNQPLHEALVQRVVGYIPQ